MDIQAIIPAGADETEVLDFSLITLTKAISQIEKSRVAHGALGGTFGYGAHWENDVFMMRPFCWCESEECPWCAGCTCPEENWIERDGDKWAKKIKYTCPYCTGSGIFERFAHKDGSPFHGGDDSYYDPPNFWHKPSDFRVTWYKYIGRSQEVYNPNNADVAEIFRECMKSLTTSA